MFKFKILPFLLFFPILITTAQVGINTTSPKLGAILDIHSADKGIYIPRVNIVDLNNIAPITDVIDPLTANGLMVFNISSNHPEGFYYWTGIKWMRLMDGEGFSNGNVNKVEMVKKIKTTTGSTLRHYPIYQDNYVKLYCSGDNNDFYISMNTLAGNQIWNWANNNGQEGATITPNGHIRISPIFQGGNAKQGRSFTINRDGNNFEIPTYRLTTHVHSNLNNNTAGYITIIIEAYYP